MANSYTLYNGNGATTDFTVSFPYIQQSHVTIEVSGASVPFTWLSTTSVRATTAPAGGTGNVKVKRSTPRTALVTFSDGAGLTAADLNLQGTQARYIAEEQEDAYSEGILTNLSVGTSSLADASVTLAKLANLATRKVIGRVTGSTGVPEAVSPDDLKVIADGATTERDLSARFSEHANVFDYGAVGNGVTDDTTAIQAALTTGKDVLIPRGYTFIVDGDLRNGANFQRIYGGGCVKKKTGNVKSVFYLLDESDGVHFDGIEIDGTLASFTVGNATSAIFGYLTKSLTVTNCYIHDNADAGIKIRDGAGLTAIGNRFYKTKNNGIELRAYINDPRTGSPYAGARPEVQGNIRIIGNNFNRIDDGGHGAGDGCGVTFDSVNGSYPYKNVTIEGNTFTDTLRCIWTENNIAGSEAINVSIIGNTLLGNVAGAGTNECKDGIGLIGVRGAIVSGNSIRNIANIVSVGDCTGITVSGGAGVTVATDVVIEGNVIIDDTGAANRTDFGILITLGAGVSIFNNRISGCSTNQISIAASNTSLISCFGNPGAETEYSWSQLWTIPFWKDNLAAASTHNLAPTGWSGDYEVLMPCSGVLVGITARLSAAISAGTITIKSYTNSVERANLQLVNADFGGGATASKMIATHSGVVVTAGQRIRVEAVTDGSWAPTTDDLFVSLTIDTGMKK